MTEDFCNYEVSEKYPLNLKLLQEVRGLRKTVEEAEVKIYIEWSVDQRVIFFDGSGVTIDEGVCVCVNVEQEIFLEMYVRMCNYAVRSGRTK